MEKKERKGKEKISGIKIKKAFIVFISFAMIFGTLLSAALPAFAKDNQTTIIMLDKVKSSYDVGERIKVRVGISSTDGSYLKSANVGFGYNGATMRLLSETDTQDHFTIESDAPQKWLYYDLEFEMITNGKMFFIAGAYDGDGVIVARKADGSKITLPRASVVYKIGTGIYTKTSDLNLESASITDKATGEAVSFNREFDKNITEYYAEVASSVSEISIDAKAESEEDQVILPDTNLIPGDNDIEIGVKGLDGTVKKYVFHIHRPAEMVAVEDISLTDDQGRKVSYTFNQDTLSYDINVDEHVSKITFEPKAGNDKTKFDLPVVDKIDAGYNIKTIKAYTDTDEKTYEFNIFRELSSLSLSSLVVEASDETAPALTPAFSPDVFEYEASVTADVRSVKLVYTLGNSGDMVKDAPEDITLNAGDNYCSVTVTDGINERVYSVIIHKAEYVRVTTEETKEIKAPIIPKDFTHYKKVNLTALLIGGGAVLLVILCASAYHVIKENTQYNKTEDAKENQTEKERKKRLKEKAKERKRERANKSE